MAIVCLISKALMIKESSPTWGPKRPKMAVIHRYLGPKLSGFPQVNFWLVLEAFFPANADADADADAIKL